MEWMEGAIAHYFLTVASSAFSFFSFFAAFPIFFSV